MAKYVTFCRICEAACGLIAEVVDGKVVKIAGDPDHPLSRGHSCIKGRALGELQHDPDRLRHPVRRTASGDWEAVSWETATTEIAGRLLAIRERYGSESLAFFSGAGGYANALGWPTASALMRGLGIGKTYSVLTVDAAPLLRACGSVFGDASYLPFPDWERARYMLVLGSNPVESQFAQSQSQPQGLELVRRARAAGARFVLVDPRRSETARYADEHHFITPGTDAFFAMALVNVVVNEGLYDRDFVTGYCSGLDDLAAAVREWTPERVADPTGVPAETTRRLARELAAARPGFCIGKTGVSMAPNGTITGWAIMALNALTGDLDRPGGLRWNPRCVEPAPIGRGPRAEARQPQSRIGGYTRQQGDFPAATLSDEILTPGRGQVRALLMMGGNPVLSLPNESKVVQAFSQLDLLVCVDYYITQTGAFAHYVLPAANPLERSDIRHPEGNRNADLPFVQFAPALVPPEGDVRHDWRIFRKLNQRLGISAFQNDELEDRIHEMEGSGRSADEMTRVLLDEMLHLVGWTCADLEKEHPHGVVIGERSFGALRANGWSTPDRRVQLAPPDLVAGLDHLERLSPPSAGDPPFYLIPRRMAAQYNTSLRNLPSLHNRVPENVALINDEDARELGIGEGDQVIVHNHIGRIRIKASPTPDVARGVVAIPVGWGHRHPSGQQLARSSPGANPNMLIDDRELERFTGNPYQTGTRVWLSVDGSGPNR